MYAFSPVVGRLADRIGHLPTAVAGQVVFIVSALLSGLSHGSVGMVMSGLFLLGLGRSFSLVAGSAMLSEATPAALRPGVQGTTDTAMNVVAAVGAGPAGPGPAAATRSGPGRPPLGVRSRLRRWRSR